MHLYNLTWSCQKLQKCITSIWEGLIELHPFHIIEKKIEFCTHIGMHSQLINRDLQVDIMIKGI